MGLSDPIKALVKHGSVSANSGILELPRTLKLTAYAPAN